MESHQAGRKMLRNLAAPWAIPRGLIQVLRQHLLKLRIKSRAATSNGAENPSQAGRHIVQLCGRDLSGPLLSQSFQACDLCKSSVVRLRLKTPAQACLQWNLLANSKNSVRSGLFRPNQHLYQFDYNSEGALLSAGILRAAGLHHTGFSQLAQWNYQGLQLPGTEGIRMEALRHGPESESITTCHHSFEGRCHPAKSSIAGSIRVLPAGDGKKN